MVGVCIVLTSCVTYVRLINQCGLYVDKIKIFEKFGRYGLYTGALNSLKFTVNLFLSSHMTELCCAMYHLECYARQHKDNICPCLHNTCQGELKETQEILIWGRGRADAC